MIQFNQVVKEYPGNDFRLGEVNLMIDPGEFVFLIGHSGSGKTSLIRLLIREENPTSGKIYFADKDITRLSRSNVYRLRRQIGVIFQDYKLIPDKTAYENVAFAMEAAGKSSAEIKETVPYMLDIVGLAHRAKAFPEQLSGGEKQRVSIARAVANNPSVLIADEPTGNLDPASAWDIVQILSKINNWGTTVIMSTHGTDIVNTLNKRVVQIEEGKVVRDDRIGKYEMVGEIRGDWEPSKVSVPKTKRSQIKVNLRNEEEKEKSKDWRRAFGIFGGKKSAPRPEIVQELESTVEEVQIAESLTNLDETMSMQILADADNTPIDELHVDEKLKSELLQAGLQDVEDVMSAGPDELVAEAIIDELEAPKLAEALGEFVMIDEERIYDKQTEALEKAQDDRVARRLKLKKPNIANDDAIEPRSKVTIRKKGHKPKSTDQHDKSDTEELNIKLTAK